MKGFTVKSNKKVLALLLTIVMMLSTLMSYPVKAEETQKFDTKAFLTLSTEKIEQGKEFSVVLNVDKTTEFGGMTFNVRYDSDKVEFVKYEKYTGSSMANNQATKSMVTYTDSGAENFTVADGKVMTVTFKAKDDAIGTADFGIDVVTLYKIEGLDEIDLTAEATGAALKIVAPPADTKALTEKITEAEGHLNDRLTTDSMTALNAAIEEAENVLKSDESTQDQVNEQIAKLDNVIKSLVTAVDTTELEKMIKNGDVLAEKLDGYTPATVAVFSQAYQEAKDYLPVAQNLENNEANVQAVAEKTKALEDAIAGLEKIPNMDDLKVSIKEAEDMLADAETTYMDVQRQALETALNEAKGVEENANATEDQVKAASEKLDKAIADAKANVAGNKEVLLTAINQYKSSYPEANYISSSYVGLKQAISDAETLYAKMENEQVLKPKVDAAIEAMASAADMLVLRATDEQKADLNKAIAQAETLLPNKEEYITSAFEAMEKALNDAKSIFDNQDVTVDQVNEANTVLQGTLTNLESQKRATDAEKAALKEAIESKENKDYYTEDSYSAYEKAYESSKAVYESKDVTKAQVDTTLAELTSAKAALVTYTKDNQTDVEVIGLPTPGTGINVKDDSKNSQLQKSVSDAIQTNSAIKDKDANVLKILNIKPNMTDEELNAFNADPNSKVTIYIPLDRSEQGYSSYMVCHIKDDGSIEWLTPEIVNDGKTLKLTVSSFSEFAVVGVKSPESPAGGDTKKPTSSDSKNAGAGSINPSTGLPYTEGELQTGAMQAMAMLALMGLAGIVLVRRRKTSVK
ncbi:cohesin domain-containing protein [Eubacterium sp.]|uniref:cohesin domain-containing protein n=1 Tax=Eubacterium sp. TaxID=142586 RepID=UPI0026E10D5A|nr:hypothetical protein [Eubacterium sp.]MDO5433607.1 hypothetical protein [Eubacterium sp.]